jgi:hypothetical protein
MTRISKFDTRPTQQIITRMHQASSSYYTAHKARQPQQITVKIHQALICLFSFTVY